MSPGLEVHGQRTRNGGDRTSKASWLGFGKNFRNLLRRARQACRLGLLEMTAWRVFRFHRATKTVRIEMICQSFKTFSQKHANGFVPLPYQPKNNDIPLKTPPTGFDALRTIAVSRKPR